VGSSLLLAIAAAGRLPIITGSTGFYEHCWTGCFQAQRGTNLCAT
jgi:hypothetical protein